jgi:diguanylate cyclase (GGDEF)-like protein/PAS domain S-box-containing protein
MVDDVKQQVQKKPGSGLVVQICAAGSGGMALFVLLSWICNAWQLGTLGRGYIPMAPSTATLFFLLGCGLLLRSRWSEKPIAQWFACFAVLITVLTSLLVLAQRGFGFELPLEHWLAPTTATIGNIPVGRMSPLTATAFLSSAVAFLLMLPPFDRHWAYRQLASLMATSTLLISQAVLLSYAVGAPLLYSSRVIPMALATAISFTMLSLGILIAVGPHTLPLSLFKAPSHSSASLTRYQFLKGPVAVFLLLVAAIGTAGYFYLRSQIAASRHTAEDTLSAVAELKVRQIVDWREERESDGRSIMSGTFASHQVREFLAGVDESEIRPEVSAWLTSVREHNQSLRAVLLDPQMNVRLASPEDKTYFGPIAAAAALKAVQSRQVVLSNLHPSRFTGEIHLDLTIPLIFSTEYILSESGGLQVDLSKGEPVGVLCLEVDPHRSLYSHLQTWPTPSLSAETMLVRREGNEVVYLNELRHRKDTALSLRQPIDQHSNKPVVMAAMGQEGFLEGEDYRDVPVLAVAQKVPGTEWFLLAKVDREEIEAPLRSNALKAGIVLFILVVTAALGVSLLWRRHDTQWLKKQLESERERKKLVDQVLCLKEQANDELRVSNESLAYFNNRLEATATELKALMKAVVEKKSFAVRFVNPLLKRCWEVKKCKHTTCPAYNRTDTFRCWEVAGTFCRGEVQGTFAQKLKDCRLCEVYQAARTDSFGTLGETFNDMMALLEDSVARTQSILDSAQDVIISMDKRGVITTWNPQAEKVFGWTAEEAVGRELAETVIPERFRDAHRTGLGSFQQTSQSRVLSQRLELTALHHDGREFPVEVSLSMVPTGGGYMFNCFLRDITTRKQIENDLRSAARTDKLTGLPNRARLHDRLQHAVELAKRLPEYYFAVMFLDLDRFKLINDSLGHEFGDLLLQAVSARLRDSLRDGDSVCRDAEGTTVARLGGDEFVVLLDGIKKPEDAAIVANRLLKDLEAPYQLGEQEVRSTASIGIVCSNAQYDNADDILRDADIAMYEAKAHGKACFVMFDASMQTVVQNRLQLENDLRTAIEEGATPLVVEVGGPGAAAGGPGPLDLGESMIYAQCNTQASSPPPPPKEVGHPTDVSHPPTSVPLPKDWGTRTRTDQFFLVYQPIVSLEDGKLRGVETLVRWDHPTRGLISPGEFIPIAEETRLILPLSYWIFEQACAQFMNWRQQDPDRAPAYISVNLSRVHLAEKDLVEQIIRTVQRAGMEPGQLQLEMTESGILQDRKAAKKVLRALKAAGIRLAMDDFGTGHSSLSCLHELPFDVLKIDQSFVFNIERGRQFIAMARTVVTLAENLGMTCVAEGVENRAQIAALQSMGCACAQGYYFGKPMSAEALIDGKWIDGCHFTEKETSMFMAY